MREKRVIIVGGGPAGAFCAFNLAKNGFQPLVFDYSQPREKPCGGGISPRAQEKFPFLEKIPIPRGSGNKIEIVSPMGLRIPAEGKKKCIAFSRLQLDQYLLEMATRAGASHLKERVVSVSKDRKGWKVKSENAEYNSDILIGADGVNSLVRKQLVGGFKKEDLSIAYGYFAKGVEDRLVIIKFPRKKKGYIWAFHRYDHSSIGIGVELAEASGIRNELDTFVQTYFPKATILSRWGAMMPTISNPETFEIPVAGDDWILIGDAAGHVDPVTGEGIIYALWSGELAAKAIIEDAPKRFDLLWRQAYGRQLIDGSKLKTLIYNEYFREIITRVASRSFSCSEFLYSMVTGCEIYARIFPTFIKKIPRIGIEYFS